ncbi:penicillin acylase family protein [Streptomyces sp. NPDC001508]|uniref:penicillin acylase family protein n=1 Tax=Streptomyces sp. NPDC001508 TaxID=3154656 RepID=UPI00332B6BFA
MTSPRKRGHRQLVGGLCALALVPAVSPAAASTGPAKDTTTTVSTTSLRHGTVTIKRDTWGTPNIYAGTTYGLFYGYGYAAAQDRLFQLDMARRGAEGTVSQVMGPAYADFDAAVRGNVDTASIRRQYTALPRRDRHILDGYAAGLNIWIDKVLRDRNHLLPKEYTDFKFAPQHWTGLDVAMVTVGTMDVRFSDHSAELSNLSQLQQLQAEYGAQHGRQVFDQLHWKVAPNAPSTLSAADLQTQAGAHRAPASHGSAGPHGLVAGSVQADATPAHLLPKGPAKVTSELTALAAPEQQPRFSNMMLVGRKRARGAGSLLLNGPQFGWYNPSYTYEVGLHGAGFDIVGNTPFAYPVVLFGHNAEIAWGATAGNGDTVDMYQEHLDPADPHRYLFDGSYRRMTVRTETIYVKGKPDRTVRVYSTVHGPVTAFDTDHHLAYSKKRTWAGQELSSLFAWVDSTQARTYAQWEKQARRLAISINWYYTDRQGDIGYVFAGHFPDRPANQDTRLPADGTGNMEWRGVQPFETGNPHILNPSEGWLANWNNSPAPGYPNSDSTPWGQADRVAVLQNQLAAKKSVSADDLWQIMKTGALTDVNRQWFLPLIRRAVQDLPANSPERQITRTLGSWNGLNTDNGRDGRYDSPGTAIMQTWLAAALHDTLGRTLPASVYAAYSDTKYPTAAAPIITGSQNISAGSQVLYNALLGKASTVPQHIDLLGGHTRNDVIRTALRETYRTLTAQYNGGPATWLAPVARQVFSPDSYLGFPETGKGAELSGPLFMNRGTENDLMVAKSGGIAGYDVMPPGESAFISPEGKPARHYQDQLLMYVNWGRKPTFFTDREVDTHLESTETVGY